MSTEYNWTPQQISELSDLQVQMYIDKINQRRKEIPNTEVGITQLVDILLKVFGGKRIKPKTIDDIPDTQKLQWTAMEKKAWIKAGMPNPQKFLEEIRGK